MKILTLCGEDENPLAAGDGLSIQVSAIDDVFDRCFPHRTIKKVLFLAPPDVDATMFNFATGRRGRYLNYPPYCFGVLASHLRTMGIDVRVVTLQTSVLCACQTAESEQAFDFDTSWKESVQNALMDCKPDFVGVTCMFSQTHQSFVNVCRKVREVAPGIPIAVGGVHVTNSLANGATRRKLLDDLQVVDFFFKYESDLSLRVFIKVIRGEQAFDSLMQVTVRVPHGFLDFGERNDPPKGEDINRIPAHDLLDPVGMSRWGKVGAFHCFKPKGTVYSTVLSNRGCRAQCTFCSVRNFNGEGVRRRSVESVVDELLMLKEHYGVGHIMWLDDDFLYSRKESIRLFNEMVRRNVDITWDCSNGVIAASCDEETIAAAAESGCIGLILGMESGNPEILRKIRKPGTVQNFLAAAEVLRNHPQIHARVFLIIGFPGETYRQILDTIEVVQQMKLDWHNVAILQPLPNTPIFDTMVAEGQLKDYDFKEARFYSGGYNKAVKKSEGGNDLLSTDFKDAFRVLDQSMVPPKEKLDDIWAYMHFHINFKPLFREDRPLKLRQQLTYVDHISDLITPENAFAMYFSGYLQHRVFGAISPETIGHLEQRLGASPYWQTRFEDFGLSVEDLRNSCFQRNSEPLMNENRSFPRELIRNSTSGLQGAE